MVVASRVVNFTEVQWWPSPVHAAAMMLIASTSWKDPDPAAPPGFEGMVRVRITQAEISEVLNTSPQTVRRVFDDLSKMQILKRAEPSRRWYMDKRVDNAAAFTRQMQRGWQYMRSIEAKANDAAKDDDGTRWLEELFEEPAPPVEVAAHTPPPRASAPTTTIRQLDLILHPQRPPSAEVRLVSAISAVAVAMGIDPAAISEWWRQEHSIESLIAFLDASNYSTVQDWIEDNIEDIREQVA